MTESRRTLLDTIANVAIIGVALLIGWSLIFGINDPGQRARSSRLSVPNRPLTLQGASTKGSASAPIAMVEFADFECPACRTFARDVMPSLERAYLSTGKLLFAFRHLPLDMHRNARAAAVASICAGKQKRFWEMHDQLYANERTQQWDFGTLAQSLSLVETEFTSCSEDESSRTALDKDVAMAKELGITGTPAFLIGRLQGEEVHVMEARTGAGKVEDVMAQVDRVLKAAGR